MIMMWWDRLGEQAGRLIYKAIGTGNGGFVALTLLGLRMAGCEIWFWGVARGLLEGVTSKCLGFSYKSLDKIEISQLYIISMWRSVLSDIAKKWNQKMYIVVTAYNKGEYIYIISEMGVVLGDYCKLKLIYC